MPPLNRPWTLLARFYDDVVPGIAEMNRHAREAVLAGEWPRIRRVLEIGCGSGATAVDLATKGLEVEALDYSPAFVRTVRERAARAGVKLRVRRGDMRDFRVARPVDLVLCEFSVLNNLDDRRYLDAVLRCAARALRPGGLLLFDVDAPASMTTKFVPAQWFEHRDFLLVLRCALEDRNRRARLDLEWFLPEGRGRYRHARETVWNVSWTTRELRRALRSAGFTSIRIHDGVDVRPPMPGAVRGTDLYFLARKTVSTRR